MYNVAVMVSGRLCAVGVEMFKKQLNEGQAGDNVGLLLRGLKREDVLRGQVSSGSKNAVSGGLLRQRHSFGLFCMSFWSAPAETSEGRPRRYQMAHVGKATDLHGMPRS